MTYDHAVKVNGKWFKAGEEVDFSSVLNAEPAIQASVEETKTEVAQEAKPVTPKRSYTKRK